MKTWYTVLKRPDYPYLEYGAYDLYEAIQKAHKIGWNYVGECEEYVIGERYARYKGTPIANNTGLEVIQVRNLEEFTDDEIERLRTLHDIEKEV